MTPHELLVAPVAHMPPVPRILDALTPAEAARRVPGGPHNIVEVAAHLVFWQAWFLDRITGRPVPMPASAGLGWPAAGEDDWRILRDTFVDGLHRAVALSETPDERSRRVEPAIEFPPLAEFTVADAVTHVAIHNAPSPRARSSRFVR